MPLSSGQILNNRYRIVKLIGQGGFGAIYRAWDTSLNVPCAVKENFDTSAEAQKQFFQEARLLAGLRHPNLPRVTDHFLIQAQGQYLVMDFIEGQSLADLAAGRRLTEAEVTPWLRQVCDALAYLHSQNPPIIHRDIKPQNIIVTPQGQAMLVDFGISKVYDPVLRTTTGGRAVTPGFSPPEQYGGSTDRTDAGSDVYALGATLYTLLTGQPPPDAIDRLAHGAALPSLSTLRPDLSPGLRQMVDGALILSHTQRPASVGALQNLLSGKAQPPQPPRAPQTQPAAIPGARPRNRRILGVLAGAALLVVVVLAVVLSRGGRGETPVATTVARAMVTAEATASATSSPAADDTVTASEPAAAPALAETVAPTVPDVTATVTETESPAASPSATATKSPTKTATPTKTKTPTRTKSPTPTKTVTPSPTATLVPGEPTPTLDAAAFNAVRVTTRSTSKTGLSVAIRYADGAPKRGSWVAVYQQTTDVSGNAIRGDRVAEGRTDDSGAAFFALPPDSYAVQLGDYSGYLWGDEYNYEVKTGQETIIAVQLGKLLVGVLDPDGRGIPGRWTGAYLQDTDVGGNPIVADRVVEARTDGTGSNIYDLTPGMYGIGIGDIAGYPWGEALNHAVLPGETTKVIVQLGRLTVGVRNAEGRGLGGKWVGMYLQKADLNDNPIKGDRILEGRTNSAGSLTWDVTAGTYAVGIGDIAGQLWGDELNYEIKPGRTTPILVTLGRLTVGLQDADGRPIQNRWAGLSFQEQDVSGNTIRGDRFLEARTDSAGMIVWDVTAGHYVLEVEEVGILLDVEVQAGENTLTDGATTSRETILSETTAAPAEESEIPSPLEVAQAPSSESGVRVNLRYGDGAPKPGSWVAVYRQLTDINGNPIRGDRVAEGRTDDTGTVFFALPPETYSVQLGDYAGYGWGNEYDYEVSAGQATVLSVMLGKLQIGVINADGKAVSGRWTGVYLQSRDISGYPIVIDRVAEARTADTGSITYDLMPGIYGVGIGDISGAAWGDGLNYAVAPGETTKILVKLGRLTVGVRDAAGKGLGGKWVGVHLQRADLNGNPIFADRILEGRTDDTGLIAWDLTPGQYAVAIGDIAGDVWGEQMNHEILPQETTPILVTLGRLTVALKDASGKAVANRWIGLSYRKEDGSRGDRFLEGRTDNTGALVWDVTAGRYYLEIEGYDSLPNVEVQAGKVTATNGKTAAVR